MAAMNPMMAPAGGGMAPGMAGAGMPPGGAPGMAGGGMPGAPQGLTPQQYDMAQQGKSLEQTLKTLQAVVSVVNTRRDSLGQSMAQAIKPVFGNIGQG